MGPAGFQASIIPFQATWFKTGISSQSLALTASSHDLMEKNSSKAMVQLGRALSSNQKIPGLEVESLIVKQPDTDRHRRFIYRNHISKLDE